MNLIGRQFKQSKQIQKLKQWNQQKSIIMNQSQQKNKNQNGFTIESDTFKTSQQISYCSSLDFGFRCRCCSILDSDCCYSSLDSGFYFLGSSLLYDLPNLSSLTGDVACCGDDCWDDGDDDGYYFGSDSILDCLQIMNEFTYVISLLAYVSHFILQPNQYLFKISDGQTYTKNFKNRIMIDWFNLFLYTILIVKTGQYCLSFTAHIKHLIKQMSLVIQLDDPFHQQTNKKLRASLAYDEAFFSALFSTYFTELSIKSHHKVYKAIDLLGFYKIILKVNIKNEMLKFQSFLLRNNSEIIFRDKKLKLIFVRFIHKYATKNQLILLVSNSGGLVTRRFLKFRSQQKRILVQKRGNPNVGWISEALVLFLQESAQFYKIVIAKLDHNISQIFRLKPKYCNNMIKSLNMCNYSYQPTYEMFKENPQNIKFYNTLNQANSIQKSSNEFKRSQDSVSLYLQDPLEFFLQNKTCLSPTFNMASSTGKLSLKDIYQELESWQDHLNHTQFQSRAYKDRQPSLTEIYSKIFISNLQINFTKKDSLIKEEIFNEIQIKNIEKVIWERFDFISFTNLKIGKISYANRTFHNKYVSHYKSAYKNNLTDIEPQIYTSTMVLKHEPLGFRSEKLKLAQNQKQDKNQGHLRWEKSIIQECFKDQSCIYLPRFFFTNQDLLKRQKQSHKIQCFMSQYMRRGTLRSWINQNGQFTSICTKVNIILYILYSLTFIHDKKVFHMDLKPMNILMDKNLIPKITDFGSAYNKEVYQKMKKQKQQYFLSFSVPYTAPQIFMKNKRPVLSSKCDIFSMGLIIYQILFDEPIFTQSTGKVSEIYNQIGRIIENQMQIPSKSKAQIHSNFLKQQHLLKNIYFCPEKLQQDKSQIYTALLNLIFRCLSCYQQKRPNLGFFIIAVKETYQSFLQYYSW